MPEGSISFPDSPTHFHKSECSISSYGDMFQYGFGGDANIYTIVTVHRSISSIYRDTAPPTYT